jgi:hypothetical protein
MRRRVVKLASSLPLNTLQRQVSAFLSDIGVLQAQHAGLERLNVWKNIRKKQHIAPNRCA